MSTAIKLSFKETIGWMLRDTELLGILGPSFMVGVACLAIAGYVEVTALSIFFTILGLGAAAVFAGMLAFGFKSAQRQSEASRRLVLQHWVRASQNAKERDRRAALLASLSIPQAMAMLDAEGFTPKFNVDGTPMLGSGIDIQGHVFGQVDASSLMTDITPMDIANGGGYTSPHQDNGPSPF